MILSAITAVLSVFAAGYGWVLLDRLAKASETVEALHTGPTGDATLVARPALRLVAAAETPPRPQVLTAGGWVDVELCAHARRQMPAGDTWRLDPADFARRYDSGLARYVYGEHTVTAGRYTGANQRDVDGGGGEDSGRDRPDTGAERLAA
ncbi:MAG TPA: hypothetical protein VGB53_05665 [Rubricoccaceae bacterium]|jgi:hypothetical protein